MNNYVDVISLRAFCGDHDALPEYADFLREAMQANLQEISPFLFQPLLDYAADPAMRTTADWLFTDAASPIVQNPERLRRHWAFHEMLNSSWLANAPFRRYLIRLLQDTSEQKFRRPKRPAEVVQHHRYCDDIAEEVSRVEGMPKFDTTWTDEARDDAIASCIDILHRYGDRYQPHANTPKRVSWGSFNNEARLSFPILDHPATAQEVAEGKAIFTLGTAAPVRVVTQPALPQTGVWTALKDNSVPGNNPPYYDRGVVIWQAEEVLQNGNWVRYYGVVGAHQIARVPAEEIEFGCENSWNSG